MKHTEIYDIKNRFGQARRAHGSNTRRLHLQNQMRAPLLLSTLTAE